MHGKTDAPALIAPRADAPALIGMRTGAGAPRVVAIGTTGGPVELAPVCVQRARSRMLGHSPEFSVLSVTPAGHVVGECRHDLRDARAQALFDVAMPPREKTAAGCTDRVAALVGDANLAYRQLIPEDQAAEAAQRSYRPSDGVTVAETCEAAQSSSYTALSVSHTAPPWLTSAGDTRCVLHAERQREWLKNGGGNACCVLQVLTDGVRLGNQLLTALTLARRTRGWAQQANAPRTSVRKAEKLVQHIEALLPEALLGRPFASVRVRFEGPAPGAAPDEGGCLVCPTFLLFPHEGVAYFMSEKSMRCSVACATCVQHGVFLRHIQTRAPSVKGGAVSWDVTMEDMTSDLWPCTPHTAQLPGKPCPPRASTWGGACTKCRVYAPRDGKTTTGIAGTRTSAFAVVDDALITCTVPWASPSAAQGDDLLRAGDALRSYCRSSPAGGRRGRLVTRSLRMLQEALPSLHRAVARVTPVRAERLMSDEVVATLESAGAPTSLCAAVRAARTVCETVSAIRQATRAARFTLLPSSQAKMLSNVYNVYVVAECAYGSPTRCVLAVHHGESVQDSDVSIIMPENKLRTDSVFFALDPRTQADSIRAKASLRRTLGIADTESVRWGRVVPYHVHGCRPFHAIPQSNTTDACVVDPRVFCYARVEYERGGEEHTATIRFTTARDVPGYSREIVVGRDRATYVTADPTWRIDILTLPC